MKSASRLSAPTNVCLCVTSKCNLNCRHCFAKSQTSEKDRSFADISRVIRELAEEKVFFVALFGGEPFLRADILDIVAFLSTFPIGITINTNGTLIDESLSKALADFKVSFVVSLDGASADIVDEIRGKGVFDRTIRGIEALGKHGHKFLISTTVMSPNCGNLADIASLGRDIGALGVRFNNVFYINNAECYLDRIVLAPEQHRCLFELSEDLKAKYGGFVSGSLLDTMDLIREVRQNGGPRPAGPIEVHPCGGAINKCAIKPDGEVIPCEVLWNTPSGNVFQKPFKEVWAHSPVLEEFRTDFSLDEKDIGECMECRYVSICYTGHRCMPYFSHGGMKNRELFCIRKWMD